MTATMPEPGNYRRIADATEVEVIGCTGDRDIDTVTVRSAKRRYYVQLGNFWKKYEVADFWKKDERVNPVDHSTCDNAWKQVRCDHCRRTYQCAPWDDLYCTDGPEHVCERCLLASAGMTSQHVIAMYPIGGEPR